MACNGHNHPPNCNCNFRGGHPSSSPSSGWGGTRKAIKSSVLKAKSRCPKCGRLTYYFKASSGGGFYCETVGPPWTRHPCNVGSEKYSPFNREGRPRLRVYKSEYERDGWIPFIVRFIEEFPNSIIIHGFILDNPGERHIGVKSHLKIDRAIPMYLKDGGEGIVKISAYDIEMEDFILLNGLDACSGPLEIELKRG